MADVAGAELRVLPPYSPEFNPVEKAFSKHKAHLRKAAERTIHGLWTAIGRILNLYSPQNAPITSKPANINQNDRKMV